MSAKENRVWCASCRKTYPDREVAAACACGHAVPAERGEWIVNVYELERLRRVPCTCGASLIFLTGAGERRVPVALDKVHRVTCPVCSGKPANTPCAVCRGRREFSLGLAHFLDCPDADKHRRAKPRPTGYASDHGARTPQAHGSRGGPPGPAAGGARLGGLPGQPEPPEDVGGRNQPAPRVARALAQRVLELVRASSARSVPMLEARLRELLGLSPAAAAAALDHLRAARLVRPLPLDGAPAWETTPRGDREDAPLTSP